MNILIYGDSNAWGYVPNINGYSKTAIPNKYDVKDIWWYPLLKDNSVIVDGLCGRAISNENPWLPGRNAMETIGDDLKLVDPDLIILQLGTNDLKSIYKMSALEITIQMSKLIDKIEEQSNANIMIISPPKIKGGNIITDTYYAGAEEKAVKLDKNLRTFASDWGYDFVSGLDLELGEDGEHLTRLGHIELGDRVLKELGFSNERMPEM